MSETQLMLLYVLLSLLLDGCSVVATANKKLKDVLITVEYRPEACDMFAEDGDKITLEYTGYLESGLEFDSTSLPERGPLNFTLGTNTVIPGLERGILGMCFGEKRKLVIPSHLAYGNQGYRTIPGDSTIYFDVALTRLKKKSILERTVTAVQFFMFPLTTSLVIFYLWQKMNESEEPLQQSNRKAKRNRRRG